MSEVATGWMEGRTCRTCGKHFFVLYPQLWRYVITEHNQSRKWFCSWGCIQAYRNGKETRPMRNKTMETAVKLVEAMEAGEDPYRFLKDQGYASPEKAYQNIKQRCREKDPELAERFPKRYVRKEPVPEEETVELVYDPSIAEEYRREQEMKAEADMKGREVDMINEVRDEVIKDENFFLVTAVKNSILGEFYYDHDHNCIDWRTGVGDEVSLEVAGWKKLERDLSGILRYLGVEF